MRMSSPVATSFSRCQANEGGEMMRMTMMLAGAALARVVQAGALPQVVLR